MTITSPLRVVVKRDRRNTFGRSALSRALRERFEEDRLTLTAPEAARLFRLPDALCARLLCELVSSDRLVISASGAYAASAPAFRTTPAPTL